MSKFVLKGGYHRAQSISAPISLLRFLKSNLLKMKKKKKHVNLPYQSL